MRMMGMVMVVAAMMVPVVRRVRKAGTRKQAQRNRDPDELGHNFDPNLKVNFSEVTSIALRGVSRESSVCI
jgi:hypothetical protein